MPDISGQSIGRYHIIEPLGEGGMATVYKAFDTRLETDVAIKIIRTDRFTPEMLTGALKRFEREAKSLARLTHPNIVKVTDYGEHEGQPYLVMVYLPGGTLKEHLGKPMPWSEAARTLIPVARALEFAHQRGIVHRDIKPSNILITESGEPMLSDFGVAKIIGDEATTGLTGTGMAVGTPEYMAPEQVNAKTADGRADIYALGIVFYEMVTGRRPFQADTPLAVLFKHLTDPLPRPTEFVPDLPEAVERVLFKALTKKPEDRYQTMGEFAVALEKIAASDQQAADSKKQEVKRESPEKTSAPVVPTAFAPPPASPKVEAKKPDLGEATLHTLAKQERPVEAKKPARPARSFKYLIPIGILVVVLGIGIPLGIHFLKPGVGNQAPSAGSPTNTAAFTPPPIFTPTLKSIPTESSVPGETSTPTLAPVLTINVPNPKIGSSWTRLADGMTMVYVPEGNFMMGSNGGAVDERPIHTVSLNAFWIDQTEVTNAMYAKCVAAGKCNPPSDNKSYTRQDYYGNWKYDDYPVIHVSWNDAAAYCQWLGASLPTEAEWEKAARGADGRDYPWGGQIDCQKANYHGCVGDTDRVGSHEIGKGPFGAINMAGNVGEWVADWYDDNYYANSPQSNPPGPTSGTVRVLRGGSWNLKDTSLRSASRSWRDPSLPGNDIGFRCAHPADATSAVINTPAPTTTTETTLGVGSTWMRPADGMVMVYVPEGKFWMGNNDGWNEKPAHTVYLDAFWIDQTEVTNAMYAQCVQSGGCAPPSNNSAYTRERYYGNSEYDNYPVVYVDWNQANAYCQWSGTRLPTEAEWEKAARSADGRPYPWGGQIDCQMMNYVGCIGNTSPVGSYISGKSSYGAYDMAGNVWEWVADWYSDNYYASSPASNPTGPSSGTKRVVHGGSWNNEATEALSSVRGRQDPTFSFYTYGFRCAHPADSTSAVISTPAPTTTTTVNIGSTWTRQADSMTMVNVPEGNFVMGSNNGNDDEKPVHNVTLDAFWIDQTEVTNAMYALCARAGVCKPPSKNSSYYRDSYYGNPEYDNYPVTYVDWNQANAYCQWAGARLPTEAEWEKAARGTDGRTFPWGEIIESQMANYAYRAGGITRAGNYERGKSPYGAYDMAGNVFEWVADWYDGNYYPNSPVNNPQGPTSGTLRIIRGGDFEELNSYKLRTTYRGAMNPSHSDQATGFRCARSAK